MNNQQSTDVYLKVTRHIAYRYDGTEAEALRLSKIIGYSASLSFIGNTGSINGEPSVCFTGNLIISTRNGELKVLPGEILVHDLDTLEWFSVQPDQFERQFQKI